MPRTFLALALLLAAPALGQEDPGDGLPLPQLREVVCPEVRGVATLDPEGRVRLGECRLPGGEVWRLVLDEAPDWLVDVVRAGPIVVTVRGQPGRLENDARRLTVRQVVSPAPPTEMDHELVTNEIGLRVRDAEGRFRPLVGPGLAVLKELYRQPGQSGSRARLLATWASDRFGKVLLVMGAQVQLSRTVDGAEPGSYWARAIDRTRQRSVVQLVGEGRTAWVEPLDVRLVGSEVQSCDEPGGPGAVTLQHGVCELLEETR